MVVAGGCRRAGCGTENMKDKKVKSIIREELSHVQNQAIMLVADFIFYFLKKATSRSQVIGPQV